MSKLVEIHEKAAVEPGSLMGPGTRVSAFAHIHAGARLGADCVVGEGVVVEPEVEIGDGVCIEGGVRLRRGVRLGDAVVVGAGVVFGREPSPGGPPTGVPRTAATCVRTGAVLGANVTLWSGITVGQHARVEPGAAVTRDVPAFAVMTGNPAHVCDYVVTVPKEDPALRGAPGAGLQPLPVGGARIVLMPVFSDFRGTLSFGQAPSHLPFIPKRYFITYAVAPSQSRGQHAHRQLHQFLACVKGSCSVLVDDGRHRARVELDQPNKGLHVPNWVWAAEFNFSSDAVLLVLASEGFDKEDYIGDYDIFLAELQKRG